MLMNRPDSLFSLGLLQMLLKFLLEGCIFNCWCSFSIIDHCFSNSLKNAFGSSHKIKFVEDRPLRLFIGVIVILMVFRGTVSFLGKFNLGV